MTKKTLILLVLCAIVIAGCGTPDTSPEPDAAITPDSHTNLCEELAKALDEKIVDTKNPAGNFRIMGFDGVVGGKLVKISSPWYYVQTDREQGKVTYTMTFEGMSGKGDMSLRTSSNMTLHYKLGEFYRFDLKHRNKDSMQLSGAFMDSEMDALEHLPECD